jgi:hypothetical protein
MRNGPKGAIGQRRRPASGSPYSGPDPVVMLAKLEALRERGSASPTDPVCEEVRGELDLVLFGVAAMLRPEDPALQGAAELLYRPCHGAVLAQRLDAVLAAVRLEHQGRLADRPSPTT